MMDDKDTQDIEIDPSMMNEEVPDVIDQGDGTSLVTMDEQTAPIQGGSFYDNLAETLDDSDLSDLARRYLDLIDQDLQSREGRDKQYAEGLKRTGIAEPAPGGANFEGASRATHPILAEAYIDFSASSIKELFPPNGPVKTKIDGKASPEKVERAERKAAYMNWQLTNEIRGYRSELERLLTQLPAGGTQFMKFYWNEDASRIEVEFVPIDNFILPYNAKNFFDCQRKFHRMEASPLMMSRKISSGVWRDYELPRSSGNFEQSATSKALEKIEGKSDSWSSEDRDRIVYEGCVFEQLEGDDKPSPYLITIDDESRKVLSMYRNWDEDDVKRAELEWIVDYNFIPWRGAYGIGLPQIIGGLSDASTGALRALLDSSLISNSATALKLKGGPSGSNNPIEITQATEIDANGMDDIRKVAMPLPFPGPSPVLFSLLGFLVNEAKGVVGTAEEKIADASNNMPVGTALALIEQGSKVFSAIHARQHDSQRRGLEIIHRLNKEHLPEKFQFGSDKEDFVTRKDFEGVMDIHPVSDPNIFSETQRFAQTQAIIQMVTQLAPVAPGVLQILDLHALFKRSLEQMKYPYIDDVLTDVPVSKPIDPCRENIALALGKPVKAYEGQDHQAHVQVHCDFAQSPFFGLSQAMLPTFMVNLINHVQDHLYHFYEELMVLDAGIENGDASKAAENLAQSSAVALKAVEVAFGKIPDLLKAAMQQMQASAPKAPENPMVAIAMQDIQGKQKIAQGQLGISQQKAQADAQSKMIAAQQKAKQAEMDYQLEIEKAQLNAQTELQKAEMDNKAAIDIEGIRIAADHAKSMMGGAVIIGEKQ